MDQATLDPVIARSPAETGRRGNPAGLRGRSGSLLFARNDEPGYNHAKLSRIGTGSAFVLKRGAAVQRFVVVQERLAAALFSRRLGRLRGGEGGPRASVRRKFMKLFRLSARWAAKLCREGAM